jgi:hypothetical protein
MLTEQGDTRRMTSDALLLIEASVVTGLTSAQSLPMMLTETSLRLSRLVLVLNIGYSTYSPDRDVAVEYAMCVLD